MKKNVTPEIGVTQVEYYLTDKIKSRKQKGAHL